VEISYILLVAINIIVKFFIDVIKVQGGSMQPSIGDG
jgi:signal peptidase I